MFKTTSKKKEKVILFFLFFLNRFDCLVIWDYELKDLNNILEKVKRFENYEKKKNI